ncbi:hypothetical protein, partial [Brevundimonas sp.]|uniref:hypothetical protein n=1 Tax=Brevundimonas sp. TaxID=1871086 RepID=UPI0025BA5F9F
MKHDIRLRTECRKGRAAKATETQGFWRLMQFGTVRVLCGSRENSSGGRPMGVRIMTWLPAAAGFLALSAVADDAAAQ